VVGKTTALLFGANNLLLRAVPPQSCYEFLEATDLIYIKDSKIKDSKGRSASPGGPL